MGLIEAILIGIQFERLQKPLIFFAMLIGLIFFTTIAVVILFGLSGIFVSDKPFDTSVLGAVFALVVFSGLFFGLTALCGHFLKKCIK